MVGKTALNKERYHLNGGPFQTLETMMIHRILEYLFYKIQVLTRYMDTSMYLNTHVPFIMSTILLFYLVDAAIIYYYIIMGYSPQKNAANVFFIVLVIMLSLWSSLYFYYRYKHRNEKIMERKVYEHSSNVWAYIFMFSPFVVLLGLALYF